MEYLHKSTDNLDSLFLPKKSLEDIVAQQEADAVETAKIHAEEV